MIAAIHVVALVFLAGNLVVHGMQALPGPACFWAAPLVLGLASRRSWLRLAGAFTAGFLWTLFVASEQLRDVLPAALEGRTIEVVGRVATLPVRRGESLGFDLEVMENDAGGGSFPDLLKLKIYDTHTVLRASDVLRAKVRLKRPRGYANAGTFDYEKWLFMRGIGARGYVTSHEVIGTGAVWSHPNVLRQMLFDRLQVHGDAMQHPGSAAALALGLSSALSHDENRILAATGTRHLFAVSGLHVGLVFGLFFLLARTVWSRFFLARFAWPANYVGSLAALPFAFAYALLAGFSVPAQRALLMLVCFIFSHLSKRRLSISSSLALTLVIVLLWDPLSSLSASFWLSFIAVAMIIFYLSAFPLLSGWKRWVGLQIGLSVAMILPTLMFFSQGSLIAPPANLFAVPLVSFLILPMTLLLTCALAVSDALVALLVHGVDFLFELFWSVEGWFATHRYVQWLHHPPGWAFIPAFAALLLLFAIPRKRLKPLALVFLLPLFGKAVPPPGPGAFEAVFLDVGQGLSVVVATHRHTLLYDAGPRFRSGFNTGRAVVVPYLRTRGVATLDALIASHTDTDHAGSIVDVMQHLSATRVLGGEPFALQGRAFEPCRAGHGWTWDGVRFEILHPPDDRWSGNNASCVLRISNGVHSLLLAADIERAAERLLRAHPKLASDVMLVPHHGSRTSSSPDFIHAAASDLAVVSAGYRNRYGFPRQDIIQRYTDRGVRVLSTIESGALTLHFPAQGPRRVSAHREQSKRYWHR